MPPIGTPHKKLVQEGHEAATALEIARSLGLAWAPKVHPSQLEGLPPRFQSFATRAHIQGAITEILKGKTGKNAIPPSSYKFLRELHAEPWPDDIPQSVDWQILCNALGIE